MFFAIVLIAIGLALLLNALGIISGSFWGFFWGILFLAIGLKMLIRQNGCPMCGWKKWQGGVSNKECDCGHDHESHQ